jgi:hypothetical protein
MFARAHRSHAKGQVHQEGVTHKRVMQELKESKWPAQHHCTFCSRRGFVWYEKNFAQECRSSYYAYGDEMKRVRKRDIFELVRNCTLLSDVLVHIIGEYEFTAVQPPMFLTFFRQNKGDPRYRFFIPKSWNPELLGVTQKEDDEWHYVDELESATDRPKISFRVVLLCFFCRKKHELIRQKGAVPSK